VIFFEFLVKDFGGIGMVFLQNSAHNVLLQGSKANMRQPAAEAVGDAI
jgi:hypothetical protein